MTRGLGVLPSVAIRCRRALPSPSTPDDILANAPIPRPLLVPVRFVPRTAPVVLARSGKMLEVRALNVLAVTWAVVKLPFTIGNTEVSCYIYLLVRFWVIAARRRNRGVIVLTVATFVTSELRLELVKVVLTLELCIIFIDRAILLPTITVERISVVVQV